MNAQCPASAAVTPPCPHPATRRGVSLPARHGRRTAPPPASLQHASQVPSTLPFSDTPKTLRSDAVPQPRMRHPPVPRVASLTRRAPVERSPHPQTVPRSVSASVPRCASVRYRPTSAAPARHSTAHVAQQLVRSPAGPPYRMASVGPSTGRSSDKVRSTYSTMNVAVGSSTASAPNRPLLHSPSHDHATLQDVLQPPSVSAVIAIADDTARARLATYNVLRGESVEHSSLTPPRSLDGEGHLGATKRAQLGAAPRQTAQHFPSTIRTAQGSSLARAAVSTVRTSQLSNHRSKVSFER